MPLHNAEIAALFGEMADLLEIEGANPFRIGAYRNANLRFGIGQARRGWLAAENVINTWPLAELRKLLRH